MKTTKKTSESGFVADLRRISDQVTIRNDYTYEVAGEPFSVAYQQAYVKWNQPLDQFGQNYGDATTAKTSLTAQLAQTLYAQFYCAEHGSHTAAKAGVNLAQMPSQAARDETIKLLSAANTTTDRLDACWAVYSMDAQGNAYAKKNDQLRYLTPNDWAFMDPSETSLKVGSVVGIKIQKEAVALQPVFYHVRSAALPAQYADYTRLYFNTTFEGAVTLVREVTTLFNRYQVPFLFKCLNHPELFNRSDSAVLYLDKTHFRFGSELVGLLLPQMRPHLKPTTPLFTRELVPGLSFSEDPGSGQSFGMSRCTYLAEGLVNAFYRGASTADARFTEVLKAFETNGIDVDRVYLKPNSKFPYDFSVFTHA
jgi:HopA1 effector protein family